MIEAITDADGDVFYSTIDVASRAKVDTSTVRRDLHNGNIKATKHGRDHLFSKSQYAAAVKFYRDKARGKRNATRTRRARPVTEP